MFYTGYERVLNGHRFGPCFNCGSSDGRAPLGRDPFSPVHWHGADQRITARLAELLTDQSGGTATGARHRSCFACLKFRKMRLDSGATIAAELLANREVSSAIRASHSGCLGCRNCGSKWLDGCTTKAAKFLKSSELPTT